MHYLHDHGSGAAMLSSLTAETVFIFNIGNEKPLPKLAKYMISIIGTHEP